ncbi:MAG: LON peptidase substrate-binding domain-containing protein [Nitrospinae bacterium]|nr:LON peptidase substrate-binding domain-containing protein [Nitrospinota bacterium]
MALHDELKVSGPLSIFPLPSTVFYPKTLLPLHVFEPRYREMTADALKGNKLIGMVLLRPGWEEHYFENPEILSVGCVGTIDRSTLLEDGKYNIILRGLSRFRIVAELRGKSYRRAEVEFLKNSHDQPLAGGGPPGATGPSRIADGGPLSARKARHIGSSGPLSGQHPLIERYRNYCARLPKKLREKHRLDFDDCETLGEAADRVAYQFDLNLGQKQSFLEELDVRNRTKTILSLIELKTGIINLSKSHLREGFDARSN